MAFLLYTLSEIFSNRTAGKFSSLEKGREGQDLQINPTLPGKTISPDIYFFTV